MSNTNTALSLQAQIDALKAENAQLKARDEAKGERPLTFKVSEKGAISVYGLTVRFPVTLYRSQWRRLIASLAQLVAFIDAHKEEVDKHEAQHTAAKAAEKALKPVPAPKGDAPAVKPPKSAEAMNDAFARFLAAEKAQAAKVGVK